MKNSERFIKLFNFSENIDRTPVVEWASWWDKTIHNWQEQGLPRNLEPSDGINAYFGQDKLHQFWFPIREAGCPEPAGNGAPIILDEKDYQAVKSFLYTDRLLDAIYQDVKRFSESNRDEDYAYWFTLEGFFWFPRTLFGIENHLFAFYDYPELMLEINQDLCNYYKKVLDIVYSFINPVFMTFAEDMSYNHGPMVAREQYDQFMHPFYRQLIPLIQAKGTKVLIDTDGNVEPLIPWFLGSEIEGILPLERMAGVDVNRIRKNYPHLVMVGGFDKTVIHLGEEAMRAEFERILPVIRSGGYIPGVDHQTPPDVSLDNYRLYMDLLREYSAKINR